MPSITNKTYLVLLLLGSIGVTIAVGFIWWSPDQRDTNFYINLIFMCFAELTLFGWPLLANDDRADDRFLMGIGMWGISWFYLLAVFCIALISKFTADYKFSLTANLLCALVLAALMISWKFSARHVVAVGAERAADRSVMEDVKAMSFSISSQLPLQGSAVIVKACEGVIEDIRFARSNSNPRSADLDGNLVSAMKTLMAQLQSSATGTEEQAQKEKSVVDTTSKIKSILSEREALLKMNR